MAIHIGNSNVQAVYVGNSEVSKIYFGAETTPIYEKSGGGEWDGTDLTGTTWELKDSGINISNSFNYAVSFMLSPESFGINFHYFICNVGPFPPAPPATGYGLTYTNSAYTIGGTYYTSSGWTNEAYRTISITGGEDATNPALIAWLQSNATLISW